jgi:tungstate transport system substrate-binding protein
MRLRLLWVAAMCAAAGCLRSSEPTPTLTLATTTSTQDSGLLDVLVPMFRDRMGITVKIVAVGTGQALELGRRGDADVLLVHDPVSEERFMAEGHGSQRRPVMFNDFVLVGPEQDPAGVRGETSIGRAFAALQRTGSPFVSRGDESGTHQKEKQVWKQANVEPRGDWYIRAGAGMGQVLRMASEKQAYTLTDRGTFLAQGKALGLVILSQGDPLLKNQYSVLLLNPEKHPAIHQQAARQLADFLISAETQRAIAEFGRDRFGEPLFFPNAAQ